MNTAERPMAQTLNIDTLEFSRRMKEGGVEEKAAETIAKTVADAIGSSDMATGTQLTLTKTELKSEINKVDTKIDKVHVELQAQIVKLSSDINSMFFKTVVSLGSLMTLIGLAIRFLTF